MALHSLAQLIVGFLKYTELITAFLQFIELWQCFFCWFLLKLWQCFLFLQCFLCWFLYKVNIWQCFFCLFLLKLIEHWKFLIVLEVFLMSILYSFNLMMMYIVFTSSKSVPKYYRYNYLSLLVQTRHIILSITHLSFHPMIY